MAKLLDGSAFPGYCHRLGFDYQTRELLTAVRSAPPARMPQSRAGNMVVWYPSKKMQCIIKAESHKVEFAFLLEAEHDDGVLEFYDQPPAIPLEYLDTRGHTQRPQHTADYFVFRAHEAGWEECKPVEALQREAQERPNRYRLDAHGTWRCPPGEAFAAQHGLYYRVRSSDQINWVAQENWLYLEDYYQNLEHLTLADETLAAIQQLVDNQPGLSLADLRVATADMPTDAVHIALVQHAVYIDLTRARLSDPTHTPVFRDHLTAQAYLHRGSNASDPSIASHPVLMALGQEIVWEQQPWRIVRIGKTDLTLRGAHDTSVVLPRALFDTWVKAGTIIGQASGASVWITPEGHARLEQANDHDLVRAIFRNRVINPEQYHDEEQQRNAHARAAIAERTKLRWKQWYRDAEQRYGSGLIGLLPRSRNSGRLPWLDPRSKALIAEVLETHFDTTARKPKRGAFGEYLKRCEERDIPAVGQRTFYAEVQRHKRHYDQTLVREGKRAAYPCKDYVREPEPTISRHGDYAWAMAHIDHTELDLALCDSKTGQPIGKCWLSLMILAPPRRIVAYYLTFDPPSYRACMMVLRRCVQRYGQLPTAITVDGGKEFASVYFEQLLALYRVRKHQRPAAEPRFGSIQERLFGTMDTEFLYHLLGNTQATKNPRTLTKSTDPQRQAVWTLPALTERVRQWTDEVYDTMRHPALGQSPRAAYAQSMQRDGARAHRLIPYDETFRMATLPSTRKGTAIVQPGVGVRMNYLDYWCEAMRDPTVERTHVKVRYDPFDVSVGYAYIDGRWRQCITPYTEFAGCSERELQVLAAELRKRNRMQHERAQVEVTQKQLAAFRRDTAAIEAVLRQQRRDRETRAAVTVLEEAEVARTDDAPAPVPVPASDQQTAPHQERPAPAVPAALDDLLVLNRIEL
jgi:putative transposase